VKFEVFTEMKIQAMVFWVVMPCSDVVEYPCHYTASELKKQQFEFSEWPLDETFFMSFSYKLYSSSSCNLTI